MAPTTLIVALDWTPNTIHSGLYLAQAKGFYAKHNLSIELLPPDAEYTKTPARQLEAGEVDLAICPSESCIAYNESGKLRLQAIYAILQRDASAIVGTKLESMRELGNGKKYGSYNAKYEDSIVKAMVANDGGDGNGVIVVSSEGKLGMFDAVQASRIDATWIFLPWEGVEAEESGVEMNMFKLADYRIPYGYSPLIVWDAGSDLTKEVLSAFVSATREGYQHAIDHPHDAVDVLHSFVSPPRSKDFMSRSQTSINEYYSDGHKLGSMEVEKWSEFLSWLRKQNLLQGPKDVSPCDLFTNEFAE